MNPNGRPPAYNAEQVEAIKIKMAEYIEKEDLPILAEFAYKNDIPRQTFYDYKEFSTLRKKLMDKKESQLEKLGAFNVINPTMAIFSLKQMGWRDRQEVTVEDKTAKYKEIINGVFAKEEEGSICDLEKDQ